MEMITAWTWAMNGDRDYADRIRHEIMERGTASDIKGGVRTYTAYQMMRFCPWMVPIVWPAYRFFRQLYARITGR